MRKPVSRVLRIAEGTAPIAGSDSGRERSRPIFVNAGNHVLATTPSYDSEFRELRVGTIVIKCFTQRSDAQEIILTAFQEENWPPIIDDPLTGKSGQDPKQRLRTGVANLNRRQRVPMLHFRVIRQGTAVAWETAAITQRRQSDSRQRTEPTNNGHESEQFE